MINPSMFGKATEKPKSANPVKAVKPKAPVKPNLEAVMQAVDMQLGTAQGDERRERVKAYIISRDPQGLDPARFAKEALAAQNPLLDAINPPQKPSRPPGTPSPLTDTEVARRADEQGRKATRANPKSTPAEVLGSYRPQEYSKVQSRQKFDPKSAEARMKAYDEQVFGQATNGYRPEGVSDDQWNARGIARNVAVGSGKFVEDSEDQQMGMAALNPRTGLKSPTTRLQANIAVGRDIERLGKENSPGATLGKVVSGISKYSGQAFSDTYFNGLRPAIYDAEIKGGRTPQQAKELLDTFDEYAGQFAQVLASLVTGGATAAAAGTRFVNALRGMNQVAQAQLAPMVLQLADPRTTQEERAAMVQQMAKDPMIWLLVIGKTLPKAIKLVTPVDQTPINRLSLTKPPKELITPEQADAITVAQSNLIDQGVAPKEALEIAKAETLAPVEPDVAPAKPVFDADVLDAPKPKRTRAKAPKPVAEPATVEVQGELAKPSLANGDKVDVTVRNTTDEEFAAGMARSYQHFVDTIGDAIPGKTANGRPVTFDMLSPKQAEEIAAKAKENLARAIEAGQHTPAAIHQRTLDLYDQWKSQKAPPPEPTPAVEKPVNAEPKVETPKAERVEQTSYGRDVESIPAELRIRKPLAGGKIEFTLGKPDGTFDVEVRMPDGSVKHLSGTASEIASPPTQKEAWQMTREEWVSAPRSWDEPVRDITLNEWRSANKRYVPLEDQGMMRYPNGISKAERARIDKRYARNLADLDASAKEYAQIKADGKLPKVQQSREIRADGLDLEGQMAGARVFHKRQVHKAHKEGKPVPAAVLADYPDLAAAAKAQPTPVPTRPEPKTPEQSGGGVDSMASRLDEIKAQVPTLRGQAKRAALSEKMRLEDEIAAKGGPTSAASGANPDRIRDYVEYAKSFIEDGVDWVKGVRDELKLSDEDIEAVRSQLDGTEAAEPPKQAAPPVKPPKPPQNATATPETPANGNYQGFAHADVKAAMEELGNPTRERNPKADADLFEEAQALAPKAEQIANDYDGSRPLSDAEQVAVGAQFTKVLNDYKDLKMKLLEAGESIEGHPGLRELNERLIKLANASDAAGTEMGRALRARRFLIESGADIDLTDIDAVLFKAGADRGVTIDELEPKYVAELEAQVAALKSEVDALNAKKAAVDTAKAEAVIQRTRTRNGGAGRTVEVVRAEKQAAVARLRDAMANAVASRSAGSGVGAFESLVRSVPEVGRALRDIIKLHIEEAKITRVDKAFYDGVRESVGEITDADGNKIELTDSDIRSTWAGYYDETTGSKDGAAANLARLRKQAGLIEKIERAVKGEAQPATKTILTPAETKRLQAVLRALLASKDGGSGRARAQSTVDALQRQKDTRSRDIKVKRKPAMNQDLRAKIQSLRKDLRLEDKIADLEEQARTGKVKQPTPRTENLTPSQQSQQATIKNLQAVAARARRKAQLIDRIERALKGEPQPPKRTVVKDPEIKKLQSQLRALLSVTDNTATRARIEKTIADLQRQLNTKSRDITVRRKPQTNQDLVDQVQSLRKDMRLEDKISDLEEQLRTGEYKTPDPKVEKLTLEQKNQQAKIKHLQAKVAAAMRMQKPLTFGDRFSRFVRSNAMSNPEARVGDVTGNTGNFIVHTLQKPVRVPIQIVLEAIFKQTGGREILYKNYGEIADGFGTEVMKRMKDTMAGTTEEALKYGTSSGITRAAGLTDAPFNVYYMREMLGELAHHEAIKQLGKDATKAEIAARRKIIIADPPEGMSSAAIDWALRQTYNVDNIFGKIEAGIVRGPAELGKAIDKAAGKGKTTAESFGKVVGTMGGGIFRFAKVIGNVALQAADHTPFFLVQPLARMAIMRRNGYSVQQMRLISDLTARGLTGSALLALGFYVKGQNDEPQLIKTKGGFVFMETSWMEKTAPGFWKVFMVGKGLRAIDGAVAAGNLTDTQAEQARYALWSGLITDQPLTGGMERVARVEKSPKEAAKLAGSQLFTSLVPFSAALKFTARTYDSIERDIKAGRPINLGSILEEKRVQSEGFEDEFRKNLPGGRTGMMLAPDMVVNGPGKQRLRWPESQATIDKEKAEEAVKAAAKKAKSEPAKPKKTYLDRTLTW